MNTVFSLECLTGYDLILVSQSPRRQELLTKLGIPFKVGQVNVEESFPETLRGAEIVEFLAKKKADAVTIQPRQLIITADTIVWYNNRLFGKPHDSAQAKLMLAELSGQTHEVFTGVGLTTTNKQHIFSVRSEVSFAPLLEQEINYYVDQFSPLDKAGAYGIQEWIGLVGIESISGSFWNVMGLPIQRLYQEIRTFIGNTSTKKNEM